MTTRRCTKCKVEQPLAAFCRDRAKPDGLNSHCRSCKTTAMRELRGTPPERFFAYAKRYGSAAERQRVWKAANPERYRASLARVDREKARAAHKRWRDRNIERERARVAAWAKGNPEKAALLAATRRAAARRACPAWANHEEMLVVYEKAAALTLETGVPHQVDHIVPLKSKRVSGLHVPANLCVLPASDNATKGNRHWPDMP